MKKVSFFLFSAIIVFCSCNRSLYPNQSETKRKEVPHGTAYFLVAPTPKAFGSTKYILDKGTNSFVLFKGKEGLVLDEMQNWLPKNAEQAALENREKIVKCTYTSIAPFTQFTKRDLKRMKKKNAKMVLELGKYKSIIIMDYDLTYVDLLTSKEDQAAIKKLKEGGTSFTPKVGNY